jgi:hypothetical protein
MAKRIKKNFAQVRFAAFVAAVFLFVMMSWSAAEMQAKNPYDKERLLKVVRLNALSTQEVVQAVQQRGVDFEVTPGIEGEFRDAGARPELIETLKTNYRPAAAPSRPSNTNTVKPGVRPSTNVPAGPPLSKSEIITLLQSGAPVARVEQFVEVRGVSFSVTPEIAREITAAGGNRSLLGAITEKATSAPSTVSSSPAARNNAPDYDDLTDQAIAAMQASNSSYAIRLLQQAASMDSSKPLAYQLLGFAQLYGNQDILSAERSMRAALERGGSAVFYVYHDHDGFFKTYCEGSLFVTRAAVTYKAKDGNHTFEAQDSKIKEAKLNGFFGSELGAFHLKVFREPGEAKKNDESKTFNFAPATRSKAESNLIISMIQSFK